MEFKKPFAALAIVCLLSGAGQVAHATGRSAGAPELEPEGASASRTADDPEPQTEDPSTVVFDTGTSPFVPDTPNQGWWSAGNDNYSLNANYVVGERCGAGEFRNFFTFDLRSLDERVTGASLRINTGRIVGDSSETLRLYDVSTDPETLNARQGQNPAIFADLGSGKVYGTYTFSVEEDDVVVDLKLNRKAVRALNRARGDFFSIGGRLLSLESDSPSAEEQYVFADSSRAQTVQLITKTRDLEPAAPDEGGK